VALASRLDKEAKATLTAGLFNKATLSIPTQVFFKDCHYLLQLLEGFVFFA
jgi:hypothetical protein